MMKKAILIALVIAGSATAATAGAPLITDPVGDANGTDAFVQLELGDMRPASNDAADLLAVHVESMYAAVPVGEDGTDYEVTGLRVRYTTLARPTTSPVSLAFRFGFRVDGCANTFDGYVHSDGPHPGDPADRSVEWSRNGEACPGKLGTEPTSWAIDVSDDGATLTVPYAGMSPDERAHLAPGRRMTQIRALTTAIVGTAERDRAWFPWFDFSQAARDFVIGEDLPADEPCTRGCPTT